MQRTAVFGKDAACSLNLLHTAKPIRPKASTRNSPEGGLPDAGSTDPGVNRREDVEDLRLALELGEDVHIRKLRARKHSLGSLCR